MTGQHASEILLRHTPQRVRQKNAACAGNGTAKTSRNAVQNHATSPAHWKPQRRKCRQIDSNRFRNSSRLKSGKSMPERCRLLLTLSAISPRNSQSAQTVEGRK